MSYLKKKKGIKGKRFKKGKREKGLVKKVKGFNKKVFCIFKPPASIPQALSETYPRCALVPLNQER